MYLLLDPSTKDILHLALFTDDKRIDFQAPGPNRELLEAIDTFLAQENFSKDDIDGIMVVVRAGGFTSTRIATVIASVFGYVRKIPLLAIEKDEILNARNLIPKLLSQPVEQYLSATYSGEPNIGF